MRCRLLLALLPVLALSTPAAADGAAGTVKAKKIWESDGAIREDYVRRVAQLIYRGDPGRASNLTVRFHGRRVTLSDPHGIRAGRNCRQLGPERARCRLRGPRPQYRPGADLALGGGDDVVRLRGRPFAGTTEVDLGLGDDRAAGSDGRDLIDDGGGRDRVQGGRGADYLFAGGRRNGADDLAGGPGRDTLGYWRRRAPVHVDLAGDADDGATGERDRVRPDLERIVGGTVADVLVGGPGDDDLDGGTDGVAVS